MAARVGPDVHARAGELQDPGLSGHPSGLQRQFVEGRDVGESEDHPKEQGCRGAAAVHGERGVFCDSRCAEGGEGGVGCARCVELAEPGDGGADPDELCGSYSEDGDCGSYGGGEELFRGDLNFQCPCEVMLDLALSLKYDTAVTPFLVTQDISHFSSYRGHNCNNEIGEVVRQTTFFKGLLFNLPCP